MSTHVTRQTTGRGRGFKSMEPQRRKEVASLGGRTAHAMGTAHKWTPEEARKAGRIGGSISKRRPRVVPHA